MPTPLEFLVVLWAMSKALFVVGGAAGSLYLLIWSAATTAQRWHHGVAGVPRRAKRHSGRARRLSASDRATCRRRG